MQENIKVHDILEFAEEESGEAIPKVKEKWNVLIVDDDASIHQTIKLALRQIVYEDKGVEFYSAHECDMAKKLLDSIDDIAVVILDVSVSKSSDGLELVDYIRNYKNNKKTRIIIITGNTSPYFSKNTIMDYDINDFKSKTDMTFQSLHTTLISMLRAFSDMNQLDFKDKELQKAYETSKVRLKAVNASNTGIAITDSEGVITWCNGAFVKITGFKKEDVVGRLWERILIKNKVEKSYGKNDYIFSMGSGKQRIAEVKYENVLDKKGRILHAVIALHDITDRENAKKSLYKDIEVARKVQRSVLPKSVENEWVRIRGVHKATEKIGGDMYYWEMEDEWTINLILLDVMGHGIATALVTMYLRSIISDHYDISKDPCDLLLALQDALGKINESFSEDIDYYFTCVVMSVDKKKNKITYVNAGHPNVILTSKSGEVRTLESTIMPIGIKSYEVIQAQEVSLENIQNIFLYSDGLLEMSTEIMHGFNSNDKTGEAMRAQMLYWFNKIESNSYEDDISLVWVEILRLGEM